MDLIALAKNVLHTQDQIFQEQNALKTHALKENTSHWLEHAFHVNDAWLPFQGRPHATIQQHVVVEISSQLMVLVVLAQFSKNQAHWLLDVEPLVLNVPHQPDNASKKMEIVCNAQHTLDVKEEEETMVTVWWPNNNVVQIYANWEKNWCQMVPAQNAQTTPEVLVFSSKVNILNACHVHQRTMKLFERTEHVDHAIHSRKQTQTTEDATCHHAKLREHTFWNKMLSSTNAQTGQEQT